MLRNNYRYRVTARVRDEAESRPGRRARWLHLLGLGVAVVAIALCIRALVGSWPSVRNDLRDAQLGWLVPAIVCAAASMIGLALQWWRWLRAYALAASPVDASAWYLGGELGKYLPGSVWTVLGRAELARRGGVARRVSYTSTLLAYGTMCISAAAVCGAAGAVMAISGGPAWGWAFLPLLAIAPVAVHPRVLGAVLNVGRRLTRGRFDAPTPPWPVTLQLVGWCIPAWLLLGASSVSFTKLLALDASPSRIILAAVAAWTVGFLAVPVPAGAGVRELVFVALCGLPAAPGAAVALLARASLLLVDAALGAAGLAIAARRTRREAAAVAVPSASGPAARTVL